MAVRAAKNGSLYEKLHVFASINEQFNVCFKQVDVQKLKESAKCDVLVEYIAREMLVIPYYFDIIIEQFPRELPRILHDALTFNDEYEFSHSRHLLNCILLSKIVRQRRDLSRFALTYFTSYPAPFETEDKAPEKVRKISSGKVQVECIDIVEATYFLLKSNPEFFRVRWEWTRFISAFISSSRDVHVRWLMYQTLALALGFNERRLKQLIFNRISDDMNLNLTYQFHANSGFSKKKWEAPPVHPVPHLAPGKLSKNALVRVADIYVPSVGRETKELLVEVPSTHRNLQKIALGLFSNRALCLQGAVGSGKTSLVTHLAFKTGRKLGETFIKLQLGDQTDSKTLLGTYKCTGAPGEFVWQPGILTQAVTEGHWLLLEDIDQANVDIASVLGNLLENHALTVPGYRDAIPVSPGFQLFVTQRLVTTYSGHHKKQSNTMGLLEKHIVQITVDPLPDHELKQIVTARHPQFDTIADRLLKVFRLFSDETSSPVASKGRRISTRDFFKWCSRTAVNFDVKSQATALGVLQHAIDVFCCSYPNPVEALDLAKQISTYLGIINEKADYYFNTYKPSLQLTATAFVSERVSLPREHRVFNKTSKFCFTRPASVLLERVMCCVRLKEPVLLVGETGTGKTSSVQYLAQVLGQKLVVINMNQQSDSTDLLGGFKPVDLKLVIAPIRQEFEEVFRDYFNVAPNKQYLSNVAQCFNKQRYSDLVKLMFKSTNAALRRLTTETETETAKPQSDVFRERWQSIRDKLSAIDAQLKQKNAMAFAFVEGGLVKAVREGYWILLDEINLANAETLDCLSGLLEDADGTFCLLERGDKVPIPRHPGFTMFACMNPSTDVGKRDLPPGLRNRFAEFYVDELVSKSDLLLLVRSYLEAMSLKDKDVENIVAFYTRIRQEVATTLTDGLGHRPHFSLRSLCRALTVASRNPCGAFRKSLHEAFCLSFLTQLDSASYEIVEALVFRYLVGDKNKAALGQPIPKPDGKECLQFEGYWVEVGTEEPRPPSDYILTRSVRRNLRDLVRVVSVGKLPVLLQGDTSVGKTSLVTYLAAASGNKCVRINNHEHTDLQEYVGSYVADPQGKLVFREGVLVEAMRKGHWIILDELNLAPTDVLEALNRVLDDNRELFIPETQETVRAHPGFTVFATQNPPGAYGGRKMLSRAFRNRFVELHFGEIPADELEHILQKRCQMAQSYAKKMIACMSDLQRRRRESAAFAGKQGFITLRDLFRWGERYRLAPNQEGLYDWDQHMVDEGYLVLAGKVRKENEKREIVDVLQKHWKRDVVLENLFTLHQNTSTVTRHILAQLERGGNRYPNLVWTFNMRRLAVLTQKAFEFKEPVLLVGETGGGKTTVCQVLADVRGQEMLTVNCHMHTESSDFVGGLRPVRDRTAGALFEWVDGPLLEAVRLGRLFLADEISLADDSVLERLNSLLEPDRCLLLAERGADLSVRDNAELVRAHPDFLFVATMNPGGDFGKKELSPALRNRFTEIWCDRHTRREDMVRIIERSATRHPNAGFGDKIVDFLEWFGSTRIGQRFVVTIRDVLTWVEFINNVDALSASAAYYHGARLVFLDGFGSGLTGSESVETLRAFETACENFLEKQFAPEAFPRVPDPLDVTVTETTFGAGPFSVPFGSEKPQDAKFSFRAPTTLANAVAVLRGMQLNKPILLEGSPGVGKTSLVTALAKMSGHKVFRVNLSEQTDISDLFGADLPVEGGAGQFAWRDGPLLRALREGSWVLLDELNLASQSVLEGLNACLDHRGEVFVPELGRTFRVGRGTRFFGCQNPMREGGARRGLPKSFLNRFVQVYVRSLTADDTEAILTAEFPLLPRATIEKMVDFGRRLNDELDKRRLGHKGAPWECNLRDLTRWCQALEHGDEADCRDTLEMIFANRMREPEDRRKVVEIFGRDVVRYSKSVVYVDDDHVYLGGARLKRAVDGVNEHVLRNPRESLILRRQVDALRSLTYCVNLNWMAIVVGGAGSGKSHLVHTLAALAGKTLRTLPVTTAMDTTDILGGFEQTDYGRHLVDIAKVAERRTLETVQNLLLEEKIGRAGQLLGFLEAYLTADAPNVEAKKEVDSFLNKCSKLEALLKELYLKSEDPAEGKHILHLIDRCAQIQKTVAADGSVSAGGRFEWVHSVLVKCVEDGSWLLIDNANLCNAAVLDRLNALLEPGGILTVCEKGADANGKMFELKPHPEFRLFLTMDPKNGEISRAMRNRGLEIYVEETVDEYDVKSLLHLRGLSTNSHLERVLDVHRFVSGLILTEKPGLSDLLRYGSLVAARILQGFRVRDALYESFVEVYFKTRSRAEFNTADAEREVRDRIERFSEGEVSRYDRHVTLNVGDLAGRSTLAQVMHQAAFFEQAIASLNSRKRPTARVRAKSSLLIWSDLERLRGVDTGEFYFVANLVANIFTVTSRNDLPYRLTHLRSKAGSDDWLAFVDRVAKVLNVFAREWANLPVDYRWLEACPRTVADGSIGDSLNLAVQIEIHKMADAMEAKRAGRNSLLAYVAQRQMKSVSNVLDAPILDLYPTLQKEFYVYLRQLAIDLGTLSPDDYVDLVLCLSWRQCLHSFVATVEFQPGGYANKLVASSKTNALAVAYRWFYKYAVVRMSEKIGGRIPDSLTSVLKVLNLAVDKHRPLMHKTSKIYRKCDHVPAHFQSEDYRHGLELIDGFESGAQPLSSHARTELIELQRRLHSEEFDDSRLETLKSLLRDDDVPSLRETRIAPVLKASTHLVLLNALVRIERGDPFDSERVVADPQVPVALGGLLALYGRTLDPRLLHQIRKLYFATGVGEKAPPTGLNPTATTAACTLLSSDRITTLENYGAAVEEHGKLSACLWKNFRAAGNESFDFLALHLEILTAHVRTFFDRLQKALDTKFCDLDAPHFSASALKVDADFALCARDIYDAFISVATTLGMDSKMRVVADLHIGLGYARAYLHSRLPSVDPLAKKAMKTVHLSKVIGMFGQMKRSFEVQRDVLGVAHPYLDALHAAATKLEHKIDEMTEGVAVGPKEVLYDYVVQQIRHAFDNILNATLLKNNREINELLNGIDDEETRNGLKTHIGKMEALIPCVETIVNDWKPYRYSYPDVFEPLLSNVAQLLYGLKIKLFVCKRRIHRAVQFEELAIASLQFPSPNPDDSSRRGHVFDGPQTDAYIKRRRIGLLKCAIYESFNLCTIDARTHGVLTDRLMTHFNRLVDEFVSSWNAQKDEEERKQKEAESLYKTRTRCDEKSEEAESHEEFLQLFPTTFEEDFPDFRKSEEPADESPPRETNHPSSAMTEDDLACVVDLHAKLVRNFTRTEWLAPDTTDKKLIPDVLTPLVEKYKLLQESLTDKTSLMGYYVDEALVGGLMVVTKASKEVYGEVGHLGETNKDFYHDPNVGEVAQCHGLLKELRAKVANLLEQWPGQPTLHSILVIVDRILNFEVTSPVSRYLAGLELLLDKCYEWEQVAHSGVSVSEFCSDLIGRIITWRKLELNKWKDLLNGAYERLQRPLIKWWVYLYNVTDQYAAGNQSNTSELIETLKCFVTTSSIAEFEGRVELLFEFHCRAAVSGPRDLANALWNLWNYYKQFYAGVKAKLKDMRAPIEKKIKDYLKIVRWKDVNYWTVRDTIQKSHKTLHKFVREYRQILLRPVSPYLVSAFADSSPETIGIWDRPLRQNPKLYHYLSDMDSYLVKSPPKDRLLTTSRKLCKDLISGAQYPTLLRNLDAFVGHVIDNAARLRNLEVDATASPDKRKSQAKAILRQKQLALAELFKSLTKMGLSYKAGLVEANARDPENDFVADPIDLEACLSHVGYHRGDEKILTIWEHCETYYYRCLVRFDVLAEALKAPLSEFGLGNIERCRGYAAHLMASVRKQKRRLTASTRLYYRLRARSKQLNQTYDKVERADSAHLSDLKAALTHAAVAAREIKLVLDSRPSDDCLADIDVPVLDPNACQNDAYWKEAERCVDGITSSVATVSNSISKTDPDVPGDVSATRLRAFVDRDVFDREMTSLIDYVGELERHLTPSTPARGVAVLKDRLKRVVADCRHVPEPQEADLTRLHAELTATIQLVFQKLYKKHRDGHPDDSTDADLRDDHLKTLIVGELTSDVADLDLERLLRTADKLLDATSKSPTKGACPMLEQLLLLAQYFITQQVSAYRITCKLTSTLLNIFVELVSKGFCVPPELSSEKDGEGQRKPSDGLGLGDGQGEKDVSDRIESEDQLEDARPAGERDEGDDSDCEEAGDGVEMSEDFDGRMQDKRHDEDDQSEADSDREEQMGETERGADELDKEIWGSDEENEADGDENEGSGDRGEEKDKGKLGAKEDKSGKTGDPQEDDEEAGGDDERDEFQDQGYDDQQVDPYHGNQPELPEPEAMDLPDDLQLDDGEGKEDDGEEVAFEEGPDKEPTNPDEPAGDDKEEKLDDREVEFSSDDEEVNGDEKDNAVEEERPVDEEGVSGNEPQAEEGDANGEEKDNGHAPDQNPSGEDGVEAMDAENSEAVDKTQAAASEDLRSEKPDDRRGESNDDGLGQSEMEENAAGHSASASNARQLKNAESGLDEEKKRRPGKSDSKRSLGDARHPAMKKRKTLEAKQSAEEQEEEPTRNDDKTDLFEHMADAGDEAPAQVVDAATDEQIEQRRGVLHDEEDDKEEKDESEVREDRPMEVDEEAETKRGEPKDSRDKGGKAKDHRESDVTGEFQDDAAIEGERVRTTTVARGTDSYHHTRYDTERDPVTSVDPREALRLRSEVEAQLAAKGWSPTSPDADRAWQKIASLTASLAQDLSEQLRLVLEPTQASQLRGDFRTGRRINMRKIIPYVASQFRKDKIWLRRTKPSKRDYQIVLAIDDSSSMDDSHSKELAFESVALISRALSLLESGQLGVVSYGEKAKVHHSLAEPFTNESGVELLQTLKFDQQRTCVGNMVEFVTELFEVSPSSGSGRSAKLLLIVSDGRGIFSEGETYVRRAIRKAKLAGIFMVFVIVDSPKNNDSILDIRQPVFKDGKLVEMRSYMDAFPFGFYVVLRDIDALPSVLSDALRQWFEIVSNVDALLC
ncbi:midasin [Cylas formicarius]|uniref:midasin n=1 Tax=Cylas formicarius TaxID=197179 RepID=UPI002958D143|nr:midasin [Cylas formicarius]